MTESNMDPVLLIAAAPWIKAELVKNLLEAEGIAILLHGQDRGFPEFGGIVNQMLTRPDVYVQRSAFERANEILDVAWGSDWREESYEEEE